MAFSWRQFVTVAEKLGEVARNTNEPFAEGALRSAVSRSYYAAFHFWSFGAKKFANFESRESGNDHHKVPEAMKGTRFKTQVFRLKSLREWRQSCDYNQSLGEIDTESLLTEAIDFARWSAKTFQELEPETV